MTMSVSRSRRLAPAIFSFAIIAAAWPAAARAQAFVDLAVGPVIPLGDQEHTDLFDAGPGATVRGGWALRLARSADVDLLLAPELDFGWQKLNTDDEASYQRFRLTAGGRLTVQNDSTGMFVRGTAGAERAKLDFSNIPLVHALCGSPVIRGPVIDTSVGVFVHGAHVYGGIEAGGSWAFHRGDRPPCVGFSGQPTVIDVLDHTHKDFVFNVFLGSTL